MAVTPNSMVFGQTIKSASAVCVAAKTTYGDSTNAVSLYAAGTNGSILRKLTAIPRATVTATQLQLFKFDGASYYFVNSVLMPAYTMATTTQAAPVDFGYSDTTTLYLPSGWTFYVGAAVALAGGIVFSAELVDL